jgi:hypothetical protein
MARITAEEAATREHRAPAVAASGVVAGDIGAGDYAFSGFVLAAARVACAQTLTCARQAVSYFSALPTVVHSRRTDRSTAISLAGAGSDAA